MLLSITQKTDHPAGSYKDMYNGSGYYIFTTNDGMLYTLNSQGDCSADYSGGQNNAFKQVCTELEVDVNGFKKPNYYGRDIFRFFITNGKGAAIVPVGALGDNNNGYWKNVGYCSDSNNSNDYVCPARILDEGWQMNY